jgi:fatty acid synthase, animal type
LRKLSICFLQGRWGSLRRLKLTQEFETKKRQDHSYVNINLLGDLTSLTWSMGPFNFGRPKGELVRVQFVGLNLRDVLIGSGKLTPNIFGLSRLDKDYVIGSEYAGVSERSRRVMGMVVAGAAGTYVEADDILTWECPDKWTLQQAATVPVVYGVVYTAFFMVGQISGGKSVLIHAGCSDVGLAALRVATSYGLIVYTTVASAQEGEFLLKTFAALTPENIGSSQDTTFEDMVKLRTRGKGVDFVLNCLEADKLQASLRCVAKGGKFLEIGQSDMARDQSMGLGQFLRAISFHSIIIDTLLRAPAAEKHALRLIIERDLKSGIIVPLKATVFPAKQVEKALRFLTVGQSTGKVLLQIRERETDEPSLPVTVCQRVHCNPQFAYMVCGDLGSFGLNFLDWLVGRNCRKLCINTKNVTSASYLNYRLRIWRSYGVEIVTCSANVATKIGCKTMVADATKLGPIGGIFNLPTSHSDAEFAQLDHKVLEECVARKITTTKLLEEISRKLCPQLQYFVVFTERDAASKSCDGLTNSVMEHIIERRHAQGLPAKVLQWNERVEQKGASCLKELDALITHDSPIVSSSVPDNWDENAEGSLIQAVMNVMSLKTVDLNKPLPELGMNPIMAAEIKQLLERELELFFTEDEIEKLTLGKIQKLTEDPEKMKLKMAKSETPMAVVELLKNLADRGISERSIVRLEMDNKSKRYSSSVLIVPGIEGVLTGVWDNLARSLAASVYVAQLKSATDEIPLSEINNQVACDVKLEVFRQTEFFYLIGYSFGAFATLEMARVLEATGMTGHVLLIDGAPEFLKKTSIRLLGDDYMADSLQSTLFMEIARVILPDASAADIKTILATPQWTERVDCIVQLARKQNRFSELYIRHVVATIFNRIRIALNIDLKNFEPIKSPIMLVRPNVMSLADIDEHYGLAQCTQGEVITKFIEGNHVTMLENPELALIINKFDPVTHSAMSFKKYIQSIN